MVWSQNAGQGRLSFPVPFFTGGNAAQTDAPAGIQDLFNGVTNRRIDADLTGTKWAWLIVGGGVVGFTGTEMRIMGSLDGGTVWDYLDGVSGPRTTLNAITGAVVAGATVQILPKFRKRVLLRAITILGNGVVDPTLGHVVMWVTS